MEKNFKMVKECKKHDDWSKIPIEEVKKMIQMQGNFNEKCKLYNLSWLKGQNSVLNCTKNFNKDKTISNMVNFYKLTQKEHNALFNDSDSKLISSFSPKARVIVDY